MNTFQIGALAEEIALCFEIERVGPALQGRVLQVSHFTAMGFDIESVDMCEDGEIRPRFIEVKTLNSDRAIYLSPNEISCLKRLGAQAWIYVVDVSNRRVDTLLRDPIRHFEQDLVPVTFKLQI